MRPSTLLRYIAVTVNEKVGAALPVFLTNMRSTRWYSLCVFWVWFIQQLRLLTLIRLCRQGRDKLAIDHPTLSGEKVRVSAQVTGAGCM